MKTLFAIGAVLLFASAVEAQDRQFPPYRSPNQKQADYQRSQSVQRQLPRQVTSRQVFVQRPSYFDCYDPYRSRYGYDLYRSRNLGYYRPLYPVYYPPVYRTWPITPYPFRIP